MHDDTQKQEFVRLNSQKKSWLRRLWLAGLLGGLAYILFFVTLGPSLGGLGSVPRAACGVVTLACAGGSYSVWRKSLKYKLKIEENGFLEIYLAKKAMEDYHRNPEQDGNRKDAVRHLALAVRWLPYPSPNSILGGRVLAGTVDIRRFVRKRLIPYLEAPPLDPKRVIDSLSILCQFLLDPTIGGIGFALRSFNDILPGNLLQPKKSLSSKASSILKGSLPSLMERTPTLSALAIASLVAVVIQAVSAIAFGAAALGFIGAMTVGAYVLFEVRKALRSRFSSNE